MAEFIISMTEFVVLCSEAVSVLLWLHICNDKKMQYSRAVLGFGIVYVLYYLWINVEESFILENIIPALCMIVWCQFEFKEKVFITMIRFLVGIICLGAIQLISLETTYWFMGMDDFEDLQIVYIIAGIISAAFSCLVYMVKQKGVRAISKPDRVTVITILYMVLILLFIKYDYSQNEETYSYMYVTLYILLGILMIYITKGLEIKHNLEQQKLQLKLSQQYGDIYEGLIAEMRRKQHDYKNQISALYSMNYISGDSNKTARFDEYAAQLDKRDYLDKLLLNCENPILAGYLYTQCNEAELKDINMDVKLSWRESCTKMPVYEVVELLGILINNAVEYLETQETDDKKVSIYIKGTEEKIDIQVANRCEYLNYKDIEKMFVKGFSTKGDDRGIGLYSLRDIVEKHKGQLLAENITWGNNNWLQIYIKI